VHLTFSWRRSGLSFFDRLLDVSQMSQRRERYSRAPCFPARRSANGSMGSFGNQSRASCLSG
jgi:hypothetical protein